MTTSSTSNYNTARSGENSMMIPEIIYIETTNKCNANCIMCPHKYLTRPIMDMPNDIFNDVLHNLKSMDLSKTQIFLHKEGEPFCDTNIVSRILQAKASINAQIGMNTNAMLMTPDIADKILTSGLDTIYFSVDGVTAETYNSIRLNCQYETVEKNIRYFLEQREKKHVPIKVIMQMLLSPDNLAEKDMFIEKWEKYHVEFYIKQMHCYLDGGHSAFPDFHSDEQIHICNDPFRLLTVLVNGNVGCCCWDYNNEYNLGNIKDSSLLALYNGHNASYMREKQQKKDCRDLSPCNRCRRIFADDAITPPSIHKMKDDSHHAI